MNLPGAVLKTNVLNRSVHHILANYPLAKSVTDFWRAAIVRICPSIIRNERSPPWS